MTTETKIRKSLSDSNTLPAMATVVSRLMNLVAEGAGAREVAQALSMDAALSARVLKVANSSLYAVSRSVKSVQQAVTLLGAEVVRNLALTFSVLDIYPLNSSKVFNYPRFWAFSLEVAVLSRMLAEKTDGVDPDETFTAGLLHNMGILFLARTVPEEYSICLDEAQKQGVPLHEMETRAIGIGHCEVGRALAEAWGLPETIQQVAAHHHSESVPESMEGAAAGICDTVIVAARLAHLLEVGDWQDVPDEDLDLLLEGRPLDKADIRESMGGALEMVKTSAEAYGLSRLTQAIQDSQYKTLEL